MFSALFTRLSRQITSRIPSTSRLSVEPLHRRPERGSASASIKTCIDLRASLRNCESTKEREIRGECSVIVIESITDKISRCIAVLVLLPATSLGSRSVPCFWILLRSSPPRVNALHRPVHPSLLQLEKKENVNTREKKRVIQGIHVRAPSDVLSGR